MFNNIFGSNGMSQPTNLIPAKLLNQYVDVFTQYDGNSWQDATIRSCVDSIAKNVSKAKVQHVRRVNGKIQKTDSQLDYLLSVRPNPFVSAFDFFYKQVCQLLIYNNAFIYIQTDTNGNVTGLYNIDFMSLELKEGINNNILYCTFNFLNNKITVPYSQMIHLRRNYFDNEIFGSDNSVLTEPVKILKAVKQSLENAVVNCSKLRGYLKAPGQVTSRDKDGILQRFIDTFTGKNSFGIGVLQSDTEYVNLTSDLKMVDSEQLQECRNDIYRFWGVNSKIVEGNFSEEDYTSFYETTIEPILIQLSQEYTYKIFTDREIGFGNEILFNTNRLEYSSLKNKVSLANTLIPTGLLTGNEVRQLFGFDELEDEDMDERLVSLNYINSKDMSEYQLGRKPKDEGKEEVNNGENGEEV